MPGMWARLAADLNIRLRRGAWYRITQLGPLQAVVEVRGRSLEVPSAFLQEGRRHFERAPAHFDDGLERPELRDAIPRAAAEPDVQVGGQASPHAGHMHVLGR